MFPLQLTSFQDWRQNLCCFTRCREAAPRDNDINVVKKVMKMMLSVFWQLFKCLIHKAACKCFWYQSRRKTPSVCWTSDEKISWRHDAALAWGKSKSTSDDDFHFESSFNSPPRATAAKTTSKLNDPDCVA